MDEHQFLAERFEAHRSHLRGVAYRMLGSLSEADDAVQEAWLNMSRADTSGIENLGGWLTTVVARVCLNMLRSRKARLEEALGDHIPESNAGSEGGNDPEQEVLMADSIGLALLVVLERLAPAERLVFVLHDMFAVSFEEIATIVGRTPDAAKQLASRARRRMRGTSTVPDAELSSQREVVSTFLAALRGGDFDGVLAVLDPDLVVRAGGAPGETRELRGARTWLKAGAVALSRAARFTRPALVDGMVGVIVAPRGRLFTALRLTITDGKIVQIEVIANPERLAQLEVAMLAD